MATKKGKKGDKGKKGGKGGLKRGGKKGGKIPGKKLPKVAECLSPSEMSKGQLMGHMKLLMAEKDRELEERNLFMLEKNKLWSMWQLTMKKMKILKDEVRILDIKIYESVKVKDKEREMQTQKLRMLQSEEVKNFGFVRLSHLHYTKNISDDIWAIENILRESSLHKKKEIRKALASFYAIIRGLHLTHRQSITDMLITLSKSIANLTSLQDRKFFERKNLWDESLTPSMDRVRLEKLGKLDHMMLAHERAVLEMKTFFDDVTTSNLGLMTILGVEIDSQKLKGNRLGRDLRWANDNFKNVHEPLEKMLRKIQDYEGQDQSMNRMLKEVQENEKLLKKKQYCQHMLDVTNECLRQQIGIIMVERNKAQMEFGRAVAKIQRQCQMRSLVYQLKAKAARNDRNLFESVSKNLTKHPSDPVDYFDELKEETVTKIRNITHNFPTLEHFALDPAEFECIEQQQSVDVGSMGLRNKFGVIRQPWRAVQRNYSRPCCRPRYKDYVHPDNIFNQLPQLAAKQIAANKEEELKGRQSTVSFLSGDSTPIVSIFPDDLSRITSKRVEEKDSKERFPTVHQVMTKQKLENVLQKVSWKEEPRCDANFEHLMPKEEEGRRRVSSKCQVKKPQSILKRQAKCVKSQSYHYY